MIRVQDLTRRYGEQRAVDSVSFEIGPGEIVGFLGPNGAGKSTLLKMVCTYLPPTSGAVEVCGIDALARPLEVRRRIGYLTEHNALFESMRVLAFLTFIGKARGLRGRRLTERIDFVVARTGLEEVLKKRVRECSKGYRQRIGLAGALIHDPPVLLLDEPTHGLDPLQVVELRTLLRELVQDADSPRAILFSSHILAEVAEISDRLLVIQRGRICMDEEVASLRARAASEGTDLEGLVVESVRGAGASAGAEA